MRNNIVRSTLALGLTGLVGVGAFAFSREGGAQATPRVAPAPEPSPVAWKPLEVKRQPLAHYLSGIRSDLFASPVALDEPVKVVPAPKPEVAAASKPAPAVTTAPPAAPPDPLAGYAYTGTVTANGRRFALLERAGTAEGVFVAVGDAAAGGTVAEVTERSVTITVAGQPRTLALREDYKLLSFDKSAAYLTAGNNPQGGAPGQPGGMPGMPGGPGAMPGMMPGGGPGMSRGGFPGGFRGGMPGGMGGGMMQFRGGASGMPMRGSVPGGGAVSFSVDVPAAAAPPVIATEVLTLPDP
jgi:hypothetical protein